MNPFDVRARVSLIRSAGSDQILKFQGCFANNISMTVP